MGAWLCLLPECPIIKRYVNIALGAEGNGGVVEVRAPTTKISDNSFKRISIFVKTITDGTHYG